MADHEEDLYTVSEAAETSGLGEGDVRTLLRLGVVEGEKVEGVWEIPEESVEDLAQFADGEPMDDDEPEYEGSFSIHANPDDEDDPDDQDDEDEDF